MKSKTMNAWPRVSERARRERDRSPPSGDEAPDDDQVSAALEQRPLRAVEVASPRSREQLPFTKRLKRTPDQVRDVVADDRAGRRQTTMISSQTQVAARRQHAGCHHGCLARDDRDHRVERREEEHDAVGPLRVRDQVEERFQHVDRSIEPETLCRPSAARSRARRGDGRLRLRRWPTTSCSTRSTCATFVADVRAAIARRRLPQEACEAIRPAVCRAARRRRLASGSLPAPAPESGMGGGIGQWPLFRAERRILSLFSLVVPPGSATPIHDHLAWGLVGLYQRDAGRRGVRAPAGRLEVLSAALARPRRLLRADPAT